MYAASVVRRTWVLLSHTGNNWRTERCDIDTSQHREQLPPCRTEAGVRHSRKNDLFHFCSGFSLFTSCSAWLVSLERLVSQRFVGCVQEARICIPVPLYHCFGMVLGSLQCLTHSATAFYPAPSFEPVATLETVQEEK